jgi:hypothetical protein
MNPEKIQYVTLFVDAKASSGRFAICDSDGEPVWYGRLFDEASGEQSADELSVALKAIWLAKQIRESLETNLLHLKLVTDATWLCTLMGKAAVLAERADQYGIRLQMSRITGSANPADKFTTGAGFQKWNENHLPSLAVLKTEAEIQEEEKDDKAAYEKQRTVKLIDKPKVSEEVIAQRREESNLGAEIGRLCRLHIGKGVPVPGAVSQGKFKQALREAHAAGRELSEAMAAEIFAQLSAK